MGITDSSVKHNEDILLKWDDSLSVGIDDIDAQHRYIIETLNKIYHDISTDSFSAIKSVALSLKSCIDEHFRCEEDYMFYIGYPDYVKHKISHDCISRGLDKILSVYFNSGVVYKDDVVKLISDWFLKDIKTEDRDIGIYARGRPEISQETTQRILQPLTGK